MDNEDRPSLVESLQCLQAALGKAGQPTQNWLCMECKSLHSRSCLVVTNASDSAPSLCTMVMSYRPGWRRADEPQVAHMVATPGTLKQRHERRQVMGDPFSQLVAALDPLGQLVVSIGELSDTVLAQLGRLMVIETTAQSVVDLYEANPDCCRGSEELATRICGVSQALKGGQP